MNKGPTASYTDNSTTSSPAGSSLVANSRPTNLQHAKQVLKPPFGATVAELAVTIRKKVQTGGSLFTVAHRWGLVTTQRTQPGLLDWSGRCLMSWHHGHPCRLQERLRQSLNERSHSQLPLLQGYYRYAELCRVMQS